MLMKRIAYLDCLRGISMLMVVYCHVELFCFGLRERELVGELFSICMLSLFFFVSGYFTPPKKISPAMRLSKGCVLSLFQRW